MEDETMAGRDAEAVLRSVTGLEEYTVIAAGEAGGWLVIDVERTRREAPCPACGTFSDRVKSRRRSMVIDAPAHGRRCRLAVTKRAFRCVTPGCERRSFTEATDQVPTRARVTTRCREAMGRAGRDRDTAGVAAEYGVSWPTAWSAISVAARAAIAASPCQRGPRALGIDETRFWWKNKWLTGLVDLDTSELIDVIEGRTRTAVEDWICGLDDNERQSIEVVVTDPHAGYRRAVLDNLDDPILVVDRFHIAMLANKALSDVRRRRINEQAGRRGRKTDPAWRARHDLLRRSENLTDNGLSRLAGAIGADTDDGTLGELAYTWAAKEYLTALYDNCHSVEHARRQLWWWYGFVATHPVPELVRLAGTISAWQDQFLAYFTTGATNGRTEGINRVIKHIKRLGYGFTNTDNYRLRLLYRCRPLPSTPPATATPAAA